MVRAVDRRRPGPVCRRRLARARQPVADCRLRLSRRRHVVQGDPGAVVAGPGPVPLARVTPRMAPASDAGAAVAGFARRVHAVGCGHRPGDGLGQYPQRVLPAELRALPERLPRAPATDLVLRDELLDGFLPVVVAVPGGIDLDRPVGPAPQSPGATPVLVVRYVFRVPVSCRDQTTVIHAARVPGICVADGALARFGRQGRQREHAHRTRRPEGTCGTHLLGRVVGNVCRARPVPAGIRRPDRPRHRRT